MTARLTLPTVTLLTVTAVDLEQAHAALLHSARCAEFGAVKMLCPFSPRAPDGRVEYVRIPDIDLIGYSRFMIESLHAHVATEHCLVVQSDGFILDPARWDERFLEYDYIGAPWPEYVDVVGGERLYLNRNSVGNGGFSLRSRKLLEATSRVRFDDLEFAHRSEDLIVCHYLYDQMLAGGIRFAPPGLAALFSIESPGIHGQSPDAVFGFHGRHWLDAWREAWLRSRTPARTQAGG
jgi:hypothetical protein